MFYLSNRKLRLFIITLLLLIFCFFLGMFNPNAETLNIEPNSSYCPSGSYTSGVFNDKWYYGCHFNQTSGDGYFKSVVNYTQMVDGYYDISGYLFTNTYLRTITMSANSTSCFITTQNGNNQGNLSSFLSFYCFNVEIRGNRLDFNTEGLVTFTTLGGLNNGLGYGKDFSIMPHFDKSINTNIGTIADNSTDIKNSINDSNIDSNNASSSASTWNNKNASDNTITQLLTLPITLLSSIVNNINNSCSSFSLGSLFGTNITLPCIDIENLIGSGLWVVIDMLFSGFMIFNIGKKCIKIFNDFTNLKSNQMDELYGGGSK